MMHTCGDYLGSRQAPREETGLISLQIIWLKDVFGGRDALVAQQHEHDASRHWLNLLEMTHLVTKP